MLPSDLLKSLREQAKKLKKAVVLPDALDKRMLEAAAILSEEALAKPILVGDEAAIRSNAGSLSIDLKNTRIVDPLKSEKLSDFTNLFFNQIGRAHVRTSATA